MRIFDKPFAYPFHVSDIADMNHPRILDEFDEFCDEVAQMHLLRQLASGSTIKSRIAFFNRIFLVSVQSFSIIQKFTYRGLAIISVSLDPRLRPITVSCMTRPPSFFLNLKYSIIFKLLASYTLPVL